MQSGTMQDCKLELKYCERCGTLGLRRGGENRVYCICCESEMARVYRAPSRIPAPIKAGSAAAESTCRRCS